MKAVHGGKKRSSAAGASLRTRAFVDALCLGTIVFGLLARARLQAGSALPSQSALRWFALGALEDAAVISFAGAACLAVCRLGAREGAARKVLGAFAIGCGVLLVVWGEAVLYFGHAPRRQDLEVAAQSSFVLQSMDAWLGGRLAAALLAWIGITAVAALWSRRARAAWSTASRLSLAGLAGVLLAILPVRVHQAEAARHPAAVLVAFLREPAPARTLTSAETEPGARDTAVRDLVRTAASRYLSDAFPLAQSPGPRSDAAPRLPDGLHPNLVFLVMEGVRAEEVGAYGGKIPNLTPNLDRIAREGVRIESASSPGTHTPEGEMALWYGLLALPHRLVLTDAPDTRLTGLPELLRDAGWRSFLWIHNSEQTFFGEDRFFVPRGFRTIDGRDFDPREPRTNWGYSDRALARHAVEALDRLEPPFAAMVLTISNHHPFQVPPDAQSTLAISEPEQRGFLRMPGLSELVGRHTVPMLKTIHYTDEAIGDFFERARARPWFARTLFVVTSDHGLPIAPLDGELTMHRLEGLRHRVPLLFYAPSWLAPATRPGPASLADVAPTILGLFALRAPQAGVGCDLLDPGGCDPSRPVVAWDDEAQTVSFVTGRLVYHRAAASSPGSDAPAEERLVDSKADPLGKRDVSASEASALARLRRLSDVYLEVYPRVVLGDRSGVPPSVPPIAGAAP